MGQVHSISADADAVIARKGDAHGWPDQRASPDKVIAASLSGSPAGSIKYAVKVIAIGEVHSAIALVQLAKVMDYRTTVIDARSVFGTEARFSHVDRSMHA